MAPRSKTSIDDFRALLGFALVGLANTILPSIIYAANYLIIPYPRPVVTLIELLPAVAVKLSLPFVIHRAPCRIRPLILAACWLIAKKVADDTPPNVPPPIRIAMTVLASVSSAAMEVSCLGMIAHSGKSALLGWGLGTGTGLLTNTVWPFLLTHKAANVLRSATGGVYLLVIILLIAHFGVLPRRLTKTDGKRRQEREREDVAVDEEEDVEEHSLIEAGQPRTRSSSPETVRSKLRLLHDLIRPDMLPLFLASGLLLLQQALARLLDGSVFGTFSRFAATYGVSLHLGTLIARSSIKFYHVRNMHLPLVALGSVVVLAFFNAVLLASVYLAFLLAFLTGLLSGLVYINVLARVMEETRASVDVEFSMGVVTAGDAGGLACGGLLGAFLDTQMCGFFLSERRWCHRAR